MSVALITDSTASLTPEVATEREVVVVPLQVIIGARSYEEGSVGATPALVAEALTARTPVSTSRPAPAAFLAAYRAAADRGAAEVVSVHLSGEMSGTVEAAQLAAREAPVPVTVVDSRQVGMSLGFAVLAAAGARDEGADAAEMARVARERAAATTSLFYVDTLEYLRRGGRIGAAAALVGSALSVKPILRIEDGQVAPYEKVRTAARALTRLEDLAVEAAEDVAGSSIEAAVFHLAAAERAAALAQRLAERLDARLAGHPVVVGELGAVLGAHVGPGMVAISVSCQVSAEES